MRLAYSGFLVPSLPKLASLLQYGRAHLSGMVPPYLLVPLNEEREMV